MRHRCLFLCFLIVQSPSHNFINRPFCKKLHHGVSKLKATTNKIQETMKIFKTKQTKTYLKRYIKSAFDFHVSPLWLMIDSTRTCDPGKGCPRCPLSKNVLEVSLLLLQVHRIDWEKRSSTISGDIVIAIRLFLICLNFFIFLFLNSHFNFNSWRT